MWDSQRIADLVRGELTGDSHVRASGCCIDSRGVKEGEIFFALVGERTDGHDYIEGAWQKGASVVIGERERLEHRREVRVPEGKALIRVESGLAAMQTLAQAWRKELGAKVVAITGSNGKTTTKDMVAAVLSEKYRTHKNLENQNNELGLPMTILNATENTEVLILEMGMRGLGQIAFLCDIACPDIGVITNIGTTHMELLGSQEAIARAKWELIEALPETGSAVLNGEDEWSVKQAEHDSHQTFFYGLEGRFHEPDLRGRSLTPFGTLGTCFQAELKRAGLLREALSSVTVYLPLPGEHNVLDALAALSVGVLLNVSLEEGCRGLAAMELSRMRLELQPGPGGSTLISDVYNANPTSMKASLQVLRERGGVSTLAILGEMYELGEASRAGHYEVGQTVADLGISELITVGPLAEEIARGALEKGLSPQRIHSFPEREGAIKKARELLAGLNHDTWVLIKASRGMKMEEVTRALRKD